MSGGHFGYSQYRLHDIVEEIDRLVRTNDDKTPDGYGGTRGYGYPPDIIEKFKETAYNLIRTAEMVQRVDWLVSGDDGVESFRERWEKEVKPPYIGEEQAKDGR